MDILDGAGKAIPIKSGESCSSGPDRTFYQICLLLGVLVIPLMVHDWLAGWPLPVYVMGAQQCFIAIAAVLYWRGFEKSGAGILASTALLSAAIFIGLSAQGLHNSAVLMLPVCVVLAAVLFDTGPYLVYSAAGLLTILSLAALQARKILVVDQWANNQPLVDILVIVLISAVVASLLVRRLRASLRRSEAYGRSLRALAAGASGPRPEFFPASCAELCRILGLEALFILELIPPESGHVTIRALAAPVDFSVPSGPLPLAGTVWADTLSKATWHTEELPVSSLPQLGLPCTSYFGAPLRCTSGNILGLVSGLSVSKLQPGELEQALLPVFLASISSELEVRRTDQALLERTRERDAQYTRNEQIVFTLQALAARLEDVREQERTRLAHEIHDDLGQQLTAMRFELAHLGRRLKGHPTSSPHQESGPSPVAELTSMVHTTIQSVRRIATELRPAILDTFGLGAAIEWLVNDFQQRTGIAASYEGPEDLVTGGRVSTALFRICQEALANVARHSGADEVGVRLACRQQWITLEIADNGRGFVLPSDELATLGLVGMRERARIVGGSLTIVGSPENGVIVSASLPIAGQIPAQACSYNSEVLA